MYIRSDQSASVETQAGAFGACVVSDQASVVGVTAVPTPITDLGSDLWMSHQIMFGDESSVTDIAKPGQQYKIDSKAMRRVDNDQDIVIVGEFSTAGSGFTLLSGGRLLIKLH